MEAQPVAQISGLGISGKVFPAEVVANGGGRGVTALLQIYVRGLSCLSFMFLLSKDEEVVVENYRKQKKKVVQELDLNHLAALSRRAASENTVKKMCQHVAK